ncbi:MAG TPA: CheR family methyltransferase [Thermoanaerobaculia bacterium]|nr:CheR family methyltransferase [Thermoanaerobaculia bacterium]
MARGDKRSRTPAEPPGRGRSWRGIVAIGASAGGLEALTTLFDALPDDTGAAFLVALHLDPRGASHLKEILARHTGMRVREAEDGLTVEADTVYVGSPGRMLSLREGRLRVEPAETAHGASWPLDTLFLSVAMEAGPRGVAVILSGSGSHGVPGASQLRAAGGLVIAQEPRTAGHESMPRHVIDAGIADRVLAPRQMPDSILRFLDNPHAAAEEIEAEEERAGVDSVLSLLLVRLGRDYRAYKRATLVRRIRRRLALSGRRDLEDYLGLLRENAKEVRDLAADLTIQVTGFFRDSEVWEALAEKVVAPLVEARPAGAEVRMWVPGCATGEEAYSLVMLVLERSERARKHFQLKVFATDSAEEALAVGRAGSYPAAGVEQVPRDRLERFFEPSGAFFKVTKQVREAVVFSHHDVLADPPFSRTDVVSCRNLLIYLVPEVQKQVLALFHFALVPDGHLLLGKSESVGDRPELFEPVSRRLRIFRRLGPARHDLAAFPLARPAPPPSPGAGRGGEEDARGGARRRPPPSDLVGRLLLERYAPPSVLVDRELRILYFHGPTEDFLIQPRGEPRQDLLAMARPNLRSPIRRVVREAAEGGSEGGAAEALLRTDGGARVRVLARRVAGRDDQEPQFLVTFERLEPPGSATPPPGGAESTVEELEGELFEARRDLQITVEELEASNEELKASNEEITSINEELQSMNEELQTSKEELHSLNEELATINTQLESKIQELEAATNDLTNLLRSSDIATLLLDRELSIRMFTPRTVQLFDVLPGDVGRPLQHFQPKVEDAELLADARGVLENLVPRETEVRDREGRWYIRRAVPYRAEDDRIDGVVLTFADVTAVKRAEEELSELNRELERRVERRTGLLRLLQDVTAIANSAASPGDAMRRALERISSQNGWELGHVYWVGEEGRLEPSALWHQDPEYREGAEAIAAFRAAAEELRLAPGEGLVGRVLVTREPEWTPDLEARPEALRRDLRGSGLGAAIAFPLFVGEEVAGVIEFYSSHSIEPEPELLEVMASIGTQLGRAVERSRADRRLSELTLQEQRRLGEELHEGLGQQVTGLTLLARSLRHELAGQGGAEEELAGELVTSLESAREQVRSLAKGLVAVQLDGRDLTSALEDLAQEICESFDLDCRVEAEEGLVIEDSRLATTLFRVAREALNNAVVHAGAATIRIRLFREEGRVVLEVEDDGAGLPGDFESRGGLGVRIMRDRAALLGGELTFGSGRKGGARVRLSVPSSVAGAGGEEGSR